MAVSAVRIYNDLYGSDVLSSFEITKRYTNPIDHSFLPQTTQEELNTARDDLKAKRKLTHIFRTNATKTALISPGFTWQITS